MRSIFWLQLAALLLATFVSGAKEKILIDSPSETGAEADVERQAKIVCEEEDSKKYAIHKFETVIGVLRYAAAWMPDCWTRYRESMLGLREILRTGENDYCGNAKLSLVERFHRKYVSKIKGDVENRKSNYYIAIPALLKHFFIYYARHLAIRCKSNAWANLEHLLDAGSPVDRYSDARREVFDKMLEEFDTNFSQEFSSLNHKDVFLFWNIVDGIAHDAKSRKLFAKYVKTSAELTPNDRYRVAIKMRDGKNLLAVQSYCRTHLRPIYARSILPVIRFADMGYMVEKLDFTSIDKRWYSITQLCETVLPMRVVDDPNLVGRFLLLTKEEASELDKEDPDVDLAQHPANDVELKLNKMKETEIPELADNFEDPKLKSELIGRNDVVKRFLIKLAPQIRDYDKSRTGRVSLSKGPAKEEEDIGLTISRELAELKKPSLMERTKDSFYRALRASVSFWPYVVILISSPLILVAGLIQLISKNTFKFHKS